MPANVVNADLDVLSGIAGKLANDVQSLQSSIVTLASGSDQNSANWDGLAKAKYNHAFSEVANAWKMLNTVLDEIQANISTSGARYDSTDSANAAKLGQTDATGITGALHGRA